MMSRVALEVARHVLMYSYTFILVIVDYLTYGYEINFNKLLTISILIMQLVFTFYTIRELRYTDEEDELL